MTGALTMYDRPSRSMPDDVGSNGDTFEVREHFRVIVRLQLKDAWYRISDDSAGLWRVHFRFVKTDGQWADNGSTAAADNSGF